MTQRPWIETHTFHHSRFKDIAMLVDEKRSRDVKISLCFPTLNEEKTIGKEILIIKSELMTRHPLIDEIVVIDSGSTDRTAEIAVACGAKFYDAAHILPDMPSYTGKGENLWKALYVTCGDIIVYLDADIKNFHHRFAYGLLGPLLTDPAILFTKSFYDRPIANGHDKLRPTGGGRVTELVVRPAFSLFFPELTQFIQPLSGEYAGYRSLLETIAFPIGYGVETAMLIDIYRHWGLDAMAQVDLDRRVHKHQSIAALGKMAFIILKTLAQRASSEGVIRMSHSLPDTMIQYQSIQSSYQAEMTRMERIERPPMIGIDRYAQKFKPGDPTHNHG